MPIGKYNIILITLNFFFCSFLLSILTLGNGKIGEIPQSSMLKSQIASGNPNTLETQNGQ
jgi:hypothetical protein